MPSIDYRTRYIDGVRELMTRLDRDQAMKVAVGGEFAGLGALMREILVAAGLEPHHSLIDVGCGSGRLTMALRPYLAGAYLGIDVVPDLLAYARETCGRPDWRFEEASDIHIPAADGSADMVCFFSVMTHLLHEDGFHYLSEASRVLRQGGTIVFSFLDFEIASHWTVFEGMLEARARREVTHHNQFMGRVMVQRWAERLGLAVVGILDGDAPQVRLAIDITMEDGRLLPREACLGQSIAVLRKGAGLMTTGKQADGSERTSLILSPEMRATAPVTPLDTIRLDRLEQRMKDAERTISNVSSDVQAILQTRSWRVIHRLKSWMRGS
jgi:SAM-dependent methyltransferase